MVKTNFKHFLHTAIMKVVNIHVYNINRFVLQFDGTRRKPYFSFSAVLRR